jgi:hypothetical protein
MVVRILAGRISLIQECHDLAVVAFIDARDAAAGEKPAPQAAKDAHAVGLDSGRRGTV